MKKAILSIWFSMSFMSFAASQPYLVKDIRPGSESSTDNPPAKQPALGVNGIYFFSADDGAHGKELWRSDGTADGTIMVKDIRPGSNASSPRNFVTLDGILYFTANDGQNGEELWRSDGTEAGTYMVRNIAPGSQSSIGGLSEIIVMDSLVYFVADDAVHSYELWKSDGTEAGTALVKDLKTGFIGSFPGGLTAWNGVLYFSAEASIPGASLYPRELYRSDGTEAGTYLVKWIGTGPLATTFGSYPDRFTPLGDQLFFIANDGYHGKELWVTDGTEQGTRMVKDLNDSADASFDITVKDALFASNGKLLFTSTLSGNEVGLWSTDGSEAGTQAVYTFHYLVGFFKPSEFIHFNGYTYFQTRDNIVGDGLWRTDGTAEGTVMVKPLPLLSSSAVRRQMVNMGSGMAFVASDYDIGYELWFSDGATDGTQLALDIRPGSANSDPAGLSLAGSTLFFSANDGQAGRELWAFSPPVLPLTLSINISREIACFGDSIGGFSAAVFGGVPPYSYTWDNPLLQGPSPANVPIGSYVLTVTDAQGSSASAAASLSSPEPITLTVSSSPETNGAQNGTATVVANGGNAPYTFTWSTSPPQFTQQAQGLSAGQYTVTVTDDNGCSLTANVEVDMVVGDSEPMAPQFSVFPNPAGEQLQLSWSSPPAGVRQMRIRDAMGRVALQLPPSSAQADISRLNSGSYFLEIELENGKLIRRQFIKR